MPQRHSTSNKNKINNNNNNRRASRNKATAATSASTKPKSKITLKQSKTSTFTSENATPSTHEKGKERAGIAVRLKKEEEGKEEGEEHGGSKDYNDVNDDDDEEKLVAIQQRLLRCFRDAFYNVNKNYLSGGGDHDSGVCDVNGDDGNRHEAIINAIQKVKQHLYHREFDAAFGEPGLREVYALRWSAARAIGYLRVFERVLGERIWSRSRPGLGLDFNGKEEGKKGCGSSNSDGKMALRRVVCLGGGGGAELVALVGWLAKRGFAKGRGENSKAEATLSYETAKLAVSIVDIADWSSVINKLQAAVTSPVSVSAYASISARSTAVAQARPLVQLSDIEVRFRQIDLLSDLDTVDDSSTIKPDVREAWLLTITFTMNELCHASFGKAYRLLSWLTANVPSGCLLLVVDSPGSYSSIRVKDGERKYPMRFYLDYALLGRRGSGNSDEGSGSAAWKRLVGEESKWLRHSQKLEYPIQLEDMRVQIHLFEKV